MHLFYITGYICIGRYMCVTKLGDATKSCFNEFKSTVNITHPRAAKIFGGHKETCTEISFSNGATVHGDENRETKWNSATGWWLDLYESPLEIIGKRGVKSWKIEVLHFSHNGFGVFRIAWDVTFTISRMRLCPTDFVAHELSNNNPHHFLDHNFTYYPNCFKHDLWISFQLSSTTGNKLETHWRSYKDVGTNKLWCDLSHDPSLIITRIVRANENHASLIIARTPSKIGCLFAEEKLAQTALTHDIPCIKFDTLCLNPIPPSAKCNFLLPGSPWNTPEYSSEGTRIAFTFPLFTKIKPDWK